MTTDNAHFDNNSKTAFTEPAANDAQANVMDLPEVPDDGTEFGGPRGSVITIMGIPKAEGADITGLTSTILAAVTDVFDDVEVAHLPDVELMNQAVFERAKAAGDMDAESEFFATPEGRVGATLMTHVIASQDRYEELAELKRWGALTKEQQDAEDQARRDRNAKENRDWHERTEKTRTEAVDFAFNTAQHWVNAPDLTPAERVHGAVHAMYDKYGIEQAYNVDGTVKDIKPGDDYAQRYDTTFASEISARSARAAKELFGKPEA